MLIFTTHKAYSGY